MIVATLLPEIIEDPELIVLLEEVNSITMQDMATNLGKCFRVIYPHVHNYEDAAVSNACMQFVYEKTHKNIVQLINLELMDTMAEILVHYHKNPECVLSAFRSLLMENNNTTTVSSETIAEFIAELLLGVLTYFESVLNSDDREKATKMKVVLSLGDIIRLMGSKLVTQFRFKIIAFLKTALECEEVNLEENCVKVWKVFTKFTDVRTLGPLLRTIFVSLEAFSVDYQKEVNEIYEYLVVENSSLLSVHIQDLFFIEETKVPQHIKTLVANQTSSQRPNDTFLEQLRKLCHHIGHENSAVRVYGIKFLTDLLRQNRNELNQLIISKIRMDPVMEEILGLLMQNCKSTNEELKLKAAECLGEIGAIEPGFHSPNYAPQKPFSDTIHSDEFAINALEQLACAYQFQNEHSNHFSLAMQEILRERGVTNENKNDSALWSAISERTRHFVEPMLRSTYTINVTTDYSQEHPIFTRFRLMSPLGWAFIWCNKMIDLVSFKKN